MHKIDNILIIIIFILTSLLFYFLKLDYNDVFYSNVITYLSISFGFIITSLSILYNSEYIKKLYKNKDYESNTLTVLHRLGRYYKINIYYSIFLILHFIILNQITQKYTFIQNMEFINLPLLFCNTFITLVLMKFFIKLIDVNIIAFEQ